MQDLIVQVQKITAKPDDMILITIGKDCDLDDANQVLGYLQEKFPDFTFIGNYEGVITNITIIEKDIPLTPLYSYEEVSNRAW